MNYILDTHVLLWSIFEPSKNSEIARNIITDRSVSRFVSIASMWEISIKKRVGKLPFSSSIAQIFAIAESRGYGIIDIDKRHLEIYNTLPLLHRDPFDGILVATAICEKMTIITADVNVQQYDAPWTW